MTVTSLVYVLSFSTIDHTIRLIDLPDRDAVSLTGRGIADNSFEEYLL